jgi:gamma-tubulin complex component 5
MSNIPQHIQLLLSLSQKPSTATHKFAHTYLTRKPDTGPTADQMLYAEIVSEPFIGAHWGKGYDEEVKDGWTDSDVEESSSGSDEEVVTPSSKVRHIRAGQHGGNHSPDLDLEETGRRGKEVLEGLKRSQYWKKQAEPVEPMREGLYGWKELTTSE